MITALIATTLIAAKADPTASQIISNMMNTYYAAKTIVGTITYTQSANGVKVVMDSQVQIDRAKKRIAISQSGKVSGQARRTRVIADGATILYPVPFQYQNASNEELKEPQMNGPVMLDERDAYMLGSAGLMDRSFPLDLLVSSRQLLERRRAELNSFAIVREDKVGDTPVKVIAGKHREFNEPQPSGLYEMWVTEDFQLLRFIVQEDIIPAAGSQKIRIFSVWDVSVKTGVPVDESVFKH